MLTYTRPDESFVPPGYSVEIDLVIYTRDRLIEAITDGNCRPTTGLCTFLQDTMLNMVDWYRNYQTAEEYDDALVQRNVIRAKISEWMQQWDEYSGQPKYPVNGNLYESLIILSNSEYYCDFPTSIHRDAFDSSHESSTMYSGQYGESRLRLGIHIIRCLNTYLYELVNEQFTTVHNKIADDVESQVTKILNGKKGSPFDFGLCWIFSYTVTKLIGKLHVTVNLTDHFTSNVDTSLHHYFNRILIKCAITWHEFSGDVGYPVSHPEYSPLVAYKSLGHVNKWAGEYGANRTRYASHIVAKLRDPNFQLIDGNEMYEIYNKGVGVTILTVDNEHSANQITTHLTKCTYRLQCRVNGGE